MAEDVHRTPRPGIGRRSAIRTLVWTTPVLAVAAHAPAFAASGTWSIASASFEGTIGGTRNNAATYQFRFTLTIPTGVSVAAPVATFTSAPAPAGNGTVILFVAPTGTVDGWAATGTDTTDTSLGAYRTFTFTRATLVGPTTVTLNFTMFDVRDADIDPDPYVRLHLQQPCVGPFHDLHGRCPATWTTT